MSFTSPEKYIIYSHLVKDLDHSNLPSTLELVCDVPSLLHARTQTRFRKCKYKFSRTHMDCTHTHARTHTRKRQQRNTYTSSPALPPGPLPSFWMACLNDTLSDCLDKKCLLHRYKMVSPAGSGPSRSRSFSGRLKLRVFPGNLNGHSTQ